MNSPNNNKERKDKILIIKESYKELLQDIVNLANKLGWKSKELEENPELLLHVFYEYLDLIK